MSAVNFKSSHFKPWEHWHCFHMKPTRNLALMGPLCFSHRWPFWTHRDLTQILCFRSSITITILCLTLSSSTTWHILFSPPCSHLPSSFPLHPNGLTLWSMLSFAILSALASSPLKGMKGVINYAKSPTYEPSCGDHSLEYEWLDPFWGTLWNRSLEFRDKRSQRDLKLKQMLSIILKEVTAMLCRRPHDRKRWAASTSWEESMADGQPEERNLCPTIIRNRIQSNTMWVWQRTLSSRTQSARQNTDFSLLWPWAENLANLDSTPMQTVT